MPDVRKEILPAAGWLYNPFFDRQVQSVLECKRTLHAKCPKQLETFLQAWPLIVFETFVELPHDKWELQRALVEFENRAPEEFSDAVMRAETGDQTGQARFQVKDGQALWNP